MRKPLAGLYERPKSEQWFWAWTLAMLGLLFALATHSLFAMLAGGAAAFLSAIVAAIWANYSFGTPLYRLSGWFKYRSPMLLEFTPYTEFTDLHLGTSFDFYLNFRWRDRGPAARRKIFLWCLEGLLAIAEEAAFGAMPGDRKIVATSYFFNDRTIEKLGFRREKAGWDVRLNLLLALPEVALCYSFTQGRPALPPIWKASKAETTAAELAANKGKIEALLARLRRER
jgi:hypothetical protein